MTTAALSKRECLLLTLAVLAALLTHGLFMVDGFGEPDQASLAISAAGWFKSGAQTTSYAWRVSPLYLMTLRAALEAGFPIGELATLMNAMNVIIGALALIPLYLLARRLTSARAAAVACLIYSFTPSFWQGNIYAVPIVIGLFWLALALLAYLRALESGGGRGWPWWLATGLLLTLALGTKADIILCCGLFPGLPAWRRQLTGVRLGLAGALPAGTLGLIIALTHLIHPLLSGTTRYAGTWQSSFPFVWCPRSWIIVATATGGIIAGALLLAAGHSLIKKQRLNLLLLAAIAACPTLLFWGLRDGNSARHLTAAYFVPILFLAASLCDWVAGNRRLIGLLAIGLFVNYWATSPVNWGFVTGGRLIASKTMMEKAIAYYNGIGEAVRNHPASKKAVVGDSYASNYILWPSVRDADQVAFVDQGHHEYRYGNKTVELRVIPEDQAARFESQGWTLFHYEPGGYYGQSSPR